MNNAYLLIGGNMGQRELYLQKAREKIDENCGTITLASSLYQTAAWGKTDQAPFLNQAIQIVTRLSAEQLLQKILSVEEELGRKRETLYGPRLIDIDILLYNDDIISAPGISIPHPQLPNRKFALQPLHEIAPNQIHPILQKTVAVLLQECPDKLAVQKIT